MPNKEKNKQKGDIGEAIAVKYLEKKGYKILERNFRYSKYGEIDIIAEKYGTLHAIEVKARTNIIFGQPFEAVTRQKILKIFKTLQYYISLQNKFRNFQIDAVSIIFDKNNSENFEIKHVTNIEL